MMTTPKILGIIAILVLASSSGVNAGESAELTAAKQKLKSGLQDPVVKKKEDWQSVNIPPNLDGTMYAYDKSSLTMTRGDRGEITGAEMAVVVTRGDESILGKHALFTFICDGSGRYRINHSYPLSTRSQLPTQESQLANIACGMANCEMMRQRGEKLVCHF